MKTKYLLMALAVPAFFAACADDELISTSQGHGPEVDGQLIELGEDFAVGLTRGEVAGTKANWHYNGGGADILYSWLPTFSGTSGAAAAQEEVIGFAWRGEVGDAKVRTNYKFTLDGFLKKGETAPKTIVCDNVPLVLNGYTFPRTTTGAINVNESSGTYTMDLQEYEESSKTMVASSTYDLTYDGDYELTGAQATTIADGLLDATKLADEDPYVRNGIFTTSNSTIFKGDYIVYFPYNPEFAEVDYLPAVSPTEFTQNVENKNRTAHLAGKTFGYGVATIEKGGSMAESFATKNLSGIVDFKVKNSQNAAVKVQKLIFVDEGEGAKGFIKQVGLDATKIAAGATGTALYVSGTEVYEPTLVLNLVKNGAAHSELQAGAELEYTLAALPTSLSKPVLYIMNDAGMCCRKELAQKNILAGEGVMFEVEIKADDKFDQALAVDTKTFIERLSEAGNGSEDATINVLGNITLDPNATVSINGQSDELKDHFLGGSTGGHAGRSIYVKNDITVNGTGTITIPADLNILIKVTGKKTLTIKNPVVIEGRGCCGTNPGQLMITAPNTGEGTIVFDGAVKNYGTMWLANNAASTSKTTVVFNNTVLNGVDEETADDDNKGVIYCAGLFTDNSAVEFNGKLTNDGTINIQPATKDLNSLTVFPYDQTAGHAYPSHQINSVAVSAENIDNNGEIVVDKYTTLTVAGAVANKGDLTVNSANVTTNSDSKDGKLTIANGASVTNSGLVENFGVINNEGSLSNNSADADIIDHIGCQFGGNAANATLGEYICDVEDTDVTKDGDRLEYAMGSKMPTTTVRFVGSDATDGQTGVYVYDLGKYNKTSLDYNFIVATDAATSVQLIATKTTGSVIQSIPVTINGKLTVDGDDTNDSKLDLSKIQLIVNDVVTINGEMTVNPTSITAAETLETATAFTAKKDVNVNGKFEVATFARTAMNANMNIAEGAEGRFNYATYTDVTNAININGTFVRVLSSGTATATPAQVWCSSYTRGSKSNIPNGYPQTPANN